VNVRQIWFLWRLYHKEVPKMGALFAGAQWLNLAALVAQLLNMATNTFPALAGNHWILALQTLLGIFLPSVGGVAHKMAYGEVQNPADRSAAAPTAPTTGIGQPIPAGSTK
jgi:hypothetical protein